MNTKPSANDNDGQRPCPICAKPAVKAHLPFCSGRCADVDLHRWLSGTYVVPGASVAQANDEEDEESDK